MNINNLKKYALIRFDVVINPSSVLLNSLKKHCSIEEHDPILILQPGCFITLFESYSDYKEMYVDFKNDLKNSITGKTFILIDITNSDIAHTYPKQFSQSLNKFLDKQEIEVSPNQNFTIEELNLQLDEAIKNENFELCEEIKNKINKQ